VQPFCTGIVKTGGFDHSSPEVIQLIKQLVNNHLTISLGGQNIPADTGHYHRFFQPPLRQTEKR